MIVDDDFMIVQSTIELLEDEYQTNGYINANDALVELKNNKYDLLILDYLMDQFNGDVFIEQLRKFDNQIFIILYTGQAELVPPLQTIRSFRIQGYVEKGDANNLLLAVETSFKALQQVETIKQYNLGLNKIINLNEIILRIQTFKEIIENSVHGLLEICENRNIELIVYDIIESQRYKVDILQSTSENLNISKCVGTLDFDNFDSNAEDIFKIYTVDGNCIGLICIYQKIRNEIIEILKIFTMQIGLSISNSILYNKSITDGLTTVYNRVFLERYIELMILEAQRYGIIFSVILLDIDFFKKVNDQYGHQSGDKVLVYFASTVRNILRKSDIVARYGGEEFAIILKNTSKNDAFDVAEKIRKQIEASSVGEQNIKFTVSIGITDYIAYDNKHSIIKRSDEALYNAKTTGRNKCVII